MKSLESQLEQSPRMPQSAWQEGGGGEKKRSGANNDSNNNNQKTEDADHTVEKLRRALEQKDQVRSGY